jgi:hypothetical protein
MLISPLVPISVTEPLMAVPPPNGSGMPSDESDGTAGFCSTAVMIRIMVMAESVSTIRTARERKLIGIYIWNIQEIIA